MSAKATRAESKNGWSGDIRIKFFDDGTLEGRIPSSGVNEFSSALVENTNNYFAKRHEVGSCLTVMDVPLSKFGPSS
jgi:hypothetical protein